MRLDEVRARSGRTEVTSVVCFAFADMVAIRSLEAEIPGDHVQLVPGIDRDLEGLVVQLLGDAPAVIVIVHSPELSAARLDEVLATFGKLRDRNHRLCVVDFDLGAPATFLDGVGAAVDEMRGRGAPSPNASGSTRPSSGPSPTRRRAPTAVAPTNVRSRAGAVEVAEAPVAAANVPERAASPGPGDDPLSTTNPGPSESGTTFPDLGPSVSNVRRGQAKRARRRTLWRRVALGAVIVGVAGSLAWASGVPDLRQPAVESAPAVGPDLPARKASLAAKPAVDAASKTHAPAKPKSIPPQRGGSANDAAAESRRVAAALDARQMHALDALLIRVASRAAEVFADGRARCGRLDVASLQGWRLPSLEELRTLRRARMLPEGEYWSSSRVGGAGLFTLSRDVTRPQERERSDAENVQTLCVRQR